MRPLSPSKSRELSIGAPFSSANQFLFSGASLPLWRSVLLGCLLLLLARALPAADTQPDLCSPSAEVQAALDALPKQTPEDTDWEFHQKELSAIKALMRQYPDNIFVQRRYIKAMSRPTEHPKVVDEYKNRLANTPGSASLAYLYAFTLIGRQSPESVKLLNAALEKDPKFPWPHFALAEIYSAPAFRDKAKADANMKAFFDACPASLDEYEGLTRYSDDRNVIGQRAAQLRALLEKRSDIHAIEAYQTLWSLEFKAAPPSEYEALRKKTAVDVQRIRALNLTNKEVWYKALEDGYKLTNDQKDSDWARNEREVRFPDPWEPPGVRKWYETHHYPGEDATAELKHAYYAEALVAATQWIKERPNSSALWYTKLDALAHLDNRPPAEIEAAADRFLKVAQENAGPTGLDSYEYFAVVEALAKKHLQPARVVELGQKGLEQSATEQKDMIDFADEKERSEIAFYDVHRDIDALGFVASAYIELQQPDQAQITLAKMDERVQDLKSLAGDKKNKQKSYLAQASKYWAGMARLAELQQRKQDAMAFYQSALLARFDAEEKSVPGEKDELVEDAKKLWVSLGGTDQAWMTWYGRRANELAQLTALRWDDASETLPAFELADLNGKTWSVQSLKGKTTFLNFWASW